MYICIFPQARVDPPVCRTVVSGRFWWDLPSQTQALEGGYAEAEESSKGSEVVREDLISA